MARSSPPSGSRPPASNDRPAGPAELPLAGLHAIVTGASRGIGAAIAFELGRLGADLTLVSRAAPALQATAERLRGETGARIAVISADLTDAHAVATLAAQLAAPAILVNNAGGAESAPFAKTDAELWHRM